METGRIIKALSGFYYVQCGETLVTCRARGRFRKDGLTPLVGDWVEISRQGSEGMLEQLLPRRNSFIRPPVCNVDLLIILASAVIPITDPFLIDRVTAIAAHQNVDVLLCINKADLDPGDALAAIYTHAGFPVLQTSTVTGQGMEALRLAMAGKVCAFSGNSGVGKTSILNYLAPDLALPVGEVSKKLGRGRHTTRHVELFPLPGGTYIADTPGFSSFDTARMDLMQLNALQHAFLDFAPYIGHCQFDDCAHLKEPGCAVRAALEAGELEASRYASYLRLYAQAEEIPEWEARKS